MTTPRHSESSETPKQPGLITRLCEWIVRRGLGTSLGELVDHRIEAAERLRRRANA